MELRRADQEKLVLLAQRGGGRMELSSQSEVGARSGSAGSIPSAAAWADGALKAASYKDL